MTDQQLQTANEVSRRIKHLEHMRKYWAEMQLRGANSAEGELWHDVNERTIEGVRQLVLADYDAKISDARAHFLSL